MQIEAGSLLAKLTLSTASTGGQLRQWTLGQLLQATVTGRAGTGEYTLKIGNQEVRAQSPVPLQSGERMTLQVIENGRQPVLQRIAPEVALRETMNQALRDNLPRQSPVSPLLANLSHLATRQEGRAQLPPAVLTAANNIFQQLPRAEQLSSPVMLRQQVENAALFLESRLAAKVIQPNTALPSNNFKASLLRLASLLPSPQGSELKPGQTPVESARQTNTAVSTALFKLAAQPPQVQNAQQPSPLQARIEAEPVARASLPLLSLPEDAPVELARQVESVLSRVVVNQLNALNSEQTGQQQWLIDIPIRENDTGKLMQLHIQKESQQQQEQETETQWTFSLSIDLGALGPLHARVSLSGERLIANLWAEQQETLELISQHSHYLDERLHNAGLQQSEIRCFRGKPELPLTDTEQDSLISHHI